MLAGEHPTMIADGPIQPASARAQRLLAGVGLAVLVFLAHPSVTRAQWIPNGAKVVPWEGIHPSLLGDGLGGAFLVWDRGGVIRFEHVGSDGSVPPGLSGGGTNFYDSPYDQRHPTLLSDGSGGMYVVWSDERWAQCESACTGLPLEIYVVRLLADGSVAPGWPEGGISVGAPPMSWPTPPQACADGVGGVVVVWSEPSPTDDGIIRARRYGPDGTSMWGASPTTVCSDLNGQFAPRLAPDGAGGAIVVWQDERAVLGGLALYGQRISSAGLAQWPANGIPLGTSLGVVAGPAQLLAGAGGGTYVAWTEAGGWTHVGHVTASGAVDWAFELGIAAPDIRMAKDGAGGALVAWGDGDIHLLHLDSDGASPPGWIGPEVVCDAPGLQADPRVASDDAGGAYLIWHDDRSGGQEIFATHIDASGGSADGWSANGRVLCSAQGTRTVQALTRDGTGGAIALWDDQRDIPTEVLYAQRLVPGGLLPAPAPAPAAPVFALVPPRPNPVRGPLLATFELPDAAAARLELLDVAGRRVEAREVGALGPGRHTITLRPSALRPGVYLMRLLRADGTRSARVAILGSN